VTVAVLAAGEFFGEGCLAGQQLRMARATAITDCTLDRLDKHRMTRILHQRHEVSELFVAHLLSRNIRYEADLVDRLLNSTEKRLARILLLLAHFGKDSKAEVVLSRISQAKLAQMLGATRSQVSHFMSKFRKLGFVDYGAHNALTVHSSLLSIVLHVSLLCRPGAKQGLSALTQKIRHRYPLRRIHRTFPVDNRRSPALSRRRTSFTQTRGN
jgi:CRP/FNR family cyclic AMP-dependent transcriptional regulator